MTTKDEITMYNVAMHCFWRKC